MHPAPRTVNVKGRFSVEIRDRHFAYEEIRSLFGSLVRDGLLEPAPASTRQRDKLERLRQFVAERRYHCSPPLAWISVSINAGRIALTRTPSDASSLARPWVSVSMAPFEPA